MGGLRKGRAAGALLYIVALAVLLLADHFVLLATAVRFDVRLTSQTVEVDVDGQRAIVPLDEPARTLAFVSGAANTREYQIDGTDSTNNLTESAAELAGLLPTPEYQFEAWMRGQYSAWSGIQVDGTSAASASSSSAEGYSGHVVDLPGAEVSSVTAWLSRPESPVSIVLLNAGQEVGSIQVDRNSRTIAVSTGGLQNAELYFPEQPLPFAAEVADTLLRVIIWALVVLGVACGATLALDWATAGVLRLLPRQWHGGDAKRWTFAADASLPGRRSLNQMVRWLRLPHRVPLSDGIAGVVVLAAFTWVIWIARVLYQAQPHVLDASAYFFQAKIFASGRLSAPAPADPAAFQGPFMLIWQGRWFAQYPPMTSLLLAVGVLAYVPWIVEPLMGSIALAGIYGLGKRLFGGGTALLAVLLGALSPFYAYLAASYLSHTMALCFEVYFLWLLVSFADSLKVRQLLGAAACLAAMFATRELSAVVIGIVASSWVVGWRWRRFVNHVERVVPAVAAAGAVLMLGLLVYLTYNSAQTGDPLLLPRLLLNPTDRYGFGSGIGFYGQHTLAAGLVIVDQLLTSLMIDLYGWPYYVTLAMIPLALLRRDERSLWDWFALTCLVALVGAQAGYFYHGIYLGPRYLYESLPFLLWLTARGFLALARLCSAAAQWWTRPQTAQIARWNRVAPRTVAACACSLLVLFNLVFYMPRQVVQHTNFTGLPANVPLDVHAIYAAHLHNAVVFTDDLSIYYNVLWPLNDPNLDGSVLYAYAPTIQDANRLANEYPSRTLDELTVNTSGKVMIVRWRP